MRPEAHSEAIRVSDFRAHEILTHRSQKLMVACVLEICRAWDAPPPDLSTENIPSKGQDVHARASGSTERDVDETWGGPRSKAYALSRDPADG